MIQADYSSGLIDDLSIGKGVIPNSAVRKSINAIFHRPRGSISQRLGTTAVGSAPSGNTVTGLHNFRSSTAANNALFASASTSLYRYDGTTWSSVATITSAKTRFLTYLDTLAVLDGTLAIKTSTDGITFVTTGGNLDAANFPITKIAALINSRVVAIGNSTNPDTAYVSSLMSSGTVSWTLGNKTVQVNPNDGAGNLTGLTGNGRIILFFKERGMYRYDEDQLQKIGYVGTPSHESICTDDQGVTYFFGQGVNGVAFYQTTGGQPVNISRWIRRYVEAISPSFYGDISAYTDGIIVEWSVGSITIDDIIYSNASLVWSISDKTWTMSNKADRFRVFSQFITSTGAITTVGGDTDGFVQTINSGNTDNGTVIESEVELPAISFTSRGRTKVVNEVVALVEHFQGLQLHLKADKGSFISLGSIDSYQKRFKNIGLRGNEFFPKITAINSGTPWEFTGLEFPQSEVIDEGYRD